MKTDGNQIIQNLEENPMPFSLPKVSIFRRIFIRLLPLVLIAAALIYSIEGITIVLVLFVLVVPFEKIFPRHKDQKIRRPYLATDVSYALIAPLMGVFATFIAIIVGVLSFAWIPGLIIRPWVEQIPESIAPYVAFLIFDFVIYWTHRFYHEIPVLWSFHAIHHSTEHLDWASGFRGHPFDGTIAAPAFFFMVAAGFDPELTGLFAVVQVLLGLFLHANVSWRLSFLHKIVITPEFHHWHHTNETDAIWTNYSTFLPIWDIIFGTYFMPQNRRPQIYGVSENIPDGIVNQLKYPLRNLGNPLWALRHPFKSIRIVLNFVFMLLKEMKKSIFRKRKKIGETPWLENQ
jgi:lathosterol oxidase